MSLASVMLAVTVWPQTTTVLAWAADAKPKLVASSAAADAMLNRV